MSSMNFMEKLLDGVAVECIEHGRRPCGDVAHRTVVGVCDGGAAGGRASLA